MPDKPERNAETNQTGEAEDKALPLATANLFKGSHETASNVKGQSPGKKRNYAQYIMGFFIAICNIVIWAWNHSFGWLHMRIWKFLNTHSPGIQALFTIVIAGLTLAYVVYSKGQWRVARDQLQDFEAVQRANLVIQAFEATWDESAPDAPVQIQCTVWNTGQTAATNLDIGTGSGGGGPMPVDKNGNITAPVIYERTPQPSLFAGPSLGANEKRDCSWTYHFGPNDSEYVRQVRAGKRVQMFDLEVAYKDVFGRTWAMNDCLYYFALRHHFNHCPIKIQDNTN